MNYWEQDPLFANRRVPLETLKNWLPKEHNHPELKKIEAMIKAKERIFELKNQVKK